MNLAPSDKKNQLNHPVENFGLTELFLDNIFQVTVPNSSEAALGHIFSKQWKALTIKKTSGDY